jgi:hypothetical protein
MFTGLGPKDALRLPRSFFKQGEIATRRSKTGEPVFWPAPSTLTAILSETPPHSAVTLCANSLDRPWTESGFRASWRKVRRKLENEGCVGAGLTLYGLRHCLSSVLGTWRRRDSLLSRKRLLKAPAASNTILLVRLKYQQSSLSFASAKEARSKQRVWPRCRLWPAPIFDRAAPARRLTCSSRN